MKFRRIFPFMVLFLLIQSSVFAVNIRDVAFNTRNAGKVIFKHNDHIDKKGMNKNCRACHDTIFNLKNKKHYSMADMNKGRSCGACHDGRKGFSLAECVRCHQTREKIYNVKATGPTRFSHRFHLAKAPDCGVCHPLIFASGHNKRFTMADMGKGKSCGACHNSKQAFSIKECSKCHPIRELLFEEKSTGNVIFSHKFHTAIYTCVACHTRLYATTRSIVKITMQNMEKGKSCGWCHDGKSAFSVKEKCESCHKM